MTPSLQTDAVIRVFLAVSAPLPRARLRNLLIDVQGITLVGEAASGALAAERCEALKPDVMVVDDRVLEDPAIASFALHQRSPAPCKFLLVAPNPLSVAYRGPVPVGSIVPLDTEGSWLIQRIDAITQRGRPSISQPDVQPVRGLQHRFVVPSIPSTSHTTPGHAWPKATPNPAAYPASRAPARDGTPQPPAIDRLATRRLDDGRRPHDAGELAKVIERLAAIQQQYAPQRDSITRLHNDKVLGRTLDVLAEVGHRSAVLVVHFWCSSPASTSPSGDIGASIARSAAAVLRTNVRNEDIVCRLDGASFAVVLLGMDAQTAPASVQRVLGALARWQGVRNNEGAVLHVAHGVGYWRPLMTAAEQLDLARRAMLAEKKARETA